MGKHVRMEKTKFSSARPRPRPVDPQLFEGEDATAYDDLFVRSRPGQHKHQNPAHAGLTQDDPEQGKPTPEKTRSAESKDGGMPFKVSPRERETILAFLAKREKRPPAPSMKVSKKDGVTTVAFDHPEPLVGQMLLTQALGANDSDFL